jgi:lipopolysaccharide transport system ATP-binding protein
MSDTIITIENLSKRYRIGEPLIHYKTLYSSIAGMFKPLASRGGGGGPQHIWALKDISLKVRRGEVLGIIGRNAAGKTTLLKVLSKITEPTEGRAVIKGRVGSLLEVGTGFHQELTGRENIYLNGAILGMKKREIDKKLDRIVSFAELEKFIDTPIKFYSSGMYVRLAFAVAAHLEPETLLVDEVLAVGDAAFQKNCLGKINDVTKEGRTVLFVSHNMPTVVRLCPKSVWLDGGRLAGFGATKDVVSSYLSSIETIVNQRTWEDLSTAPGDEYLRLRAVSVLGEDKSVAVSLHQDAPFFLKIDYQILKPMMSAHVGFKLRTSDGTVVFTSFDADNPEWSGRGRRPGRYVSECLIPANLLNQGSYHLSLMAGITYFKSCFRIDGLLSLDIKGPIKGISPVARSSIVREGIILPDLKWNIEKES